MTTHRDERGAVAVLSAILAVVLFGIGAVVIDLGQAWKNRALLQTSVDVSVMAAAADLDQESECNTEVADTARQFLGDALSADAKSDNHVTGQLDEFSLDGSREDGAIHCPGNWRVHLTAPSSRVDYGLAKVLGVEGDHVTVAADATAGLLSPKMGVWPVYAVAGCDMGPQTLIDPASGHTTPVTPVLSPASTTATNPKLSTLNDGDLEPTSTPLNTPATLTLTGVQLNDVTTVGFTRESAPVDVGGHETVDLPAPNGSNNSITGVALPAAVYNTEAVWWVRVSKDNGTTWSNVDSAKAYVVGEPTLRCEGGSTSGNFGVVNLPNSGENGNWQETASNIASGLEYMLQTFPGAPSGPNPCAGQPDAVTVGSTSPGGDPVNCLETQSTTGIATNAVTGGLLEGVGTHDALLDAPTSDLCGGGEWSVPNMPGSSYIDHANDDRLECFLTGGATVSSITTNTLPASLEGSLDPAILESPRFFWVPVFSVDPGPGGSSSYAIQDFRPAFLTGPDVSTTIHNGIELTNSGIATLDVTFFNAKALPQTVDPSGETMDYLGVGPKIIRMVE